MNKERMGVKRCIEGGKGERAIKVRDPEVASRTVEVARYDG